jgi:hopene-associated glycosyltransferase HpnB
MMYFAMIPMVIWFYLLFARGGFWQFRERDDVDVPSEIPARWPSIAVVVPARDEAGFVMQSIASLLAQDYPGELRIVLVDDQSSDGTAAAARAAISAATASRKAEIVSGTSRPSGWTGKLWAVQNGIAQATNGYAPDYVLLTDADIEHAPDNVRSLVTRAEARGLVLTSLMAKLHCKRAAEQFLIPAFVFFFAMLYPFRWVNDPRRATAAAAGGCMLVKRNALEAAGGIAAIKGEIIDDCALARRMKLQGPIWLGLTKRAVSLRPYGSMRDIGSMVARTAYTQLRHSPALLAFALAMMLIVFFAPVVFSCVGDTGTQLSGATAGLLMLFMFQPILGFYGLSAFWGFLVPFMGMAYALFTLRSAWRFWRGVGGLWKGRAQAVA